MCVVTLISLTAVVLCVRQHGYCTKSAVCHSDDGVTLASVPVRIYRRKGKDIRGKSKLIESYVIITFS